MALRQDPPLAERVGLALDPTTGRHLLEELTARTADWSSRACRRSWSSRPRSGWRLRRFLEPSFPRLTVLAFQELPGATEIENAGIIPLPAHLARADAALKAAA